MLNNMVCAKTVFCCLCPTFLQPVTWRSYRLCQHVLHVHVCSQFFRNKRVDSFYWPIFREILLYVMFLEYSCSKNLESLLLIVDRYLLAHPIYNHLVTCISIVFLVLKWIGNCHRAVLTNGHTGHVTRAPGFFFFLRGPQLAVVKYFFKLIILLLMLLHDRTNTSSAYLVNLT